MSPDTNPLTNWLNTPPKETRLILLSDDTNDRALQGASASSNKKEYIEWHTLAIRFEVLQAVEREWEAIKTKHHIPNNYLHSNHHSSILLAPSSSIRKDIHELLSAYNIYNYFSSRSRETIQEYIKRNKNNPLYQTVIQNVGWALNQDKEQSLFWHMEMLDKQLEKDFYRVAAKSFCDQTERSTTSSRQYTSPQATWYYREHLQLKIIDQKVSCRMWPDGVPRDIIGRLIDLADYCAWSSRRVKSMIGARDYAYKKLTVKGVNSKLKAMQKFGDREQATLFIERMNQKLIRLLDPAEVYK